MQFAAAAVHTGGDERVWVVKGFRPQVVMSGSLPAVALGGAAGALSRWGVLSLSGADTSRLALFAVNVAGSLLLGLIFGSRERIGDRWFALLGTGFAGGLTTFSTFAVTVAADLEDGELVAAATDALGTMVTVLLGAGVGYRLGRLAGTRRWISPNGRLGWLVRRRSRTAGRSRRSAR